MMRQNKLVMSIALGMILVFADARWATADDTTTGSGTIASGTWRTPRNEVSSVASRSPGTWMQRGLADAAERQSTILDDLGGATPSAEAPSSRRAVLLNAALESIFDSLYDAVEAFKVALKAGQLTSLFEQTAS